MGTPGKESEYSKVVVIYNKDATFGVSTVNPFKNSLKLTVFLPANGEVKIVLYDAYGNSVSKKSLELYKGNTGIELDNVAKLPAGVYFLRTQFNNSLRQNKLFKLN